MISYSILTRSSYLFYKKYYPNLNIIKKIDTINLIWHFPNDDGSIVKELFKYLESDDGRADIQRLKNKYYSRDTISSYIFIGSRLFISDMITKLPEFENIFKKTALKYNRPLHHSSEFRFSLIKVTFQKSVKMVKAKTLL